MVAVAAEAEMEVVEVAVAEVMAAGEVEALALTECLTVVNGTATVGTQAG